MRRFHRNGEQLVSVRTQAQLNPDVYGDGEARG